MASEDREESPEEAADFVRWNAEQICENGLRLSRLYERHAPREPGRWPDSTILCYALLARAHYTLNTILALGERGVDSVVLARTVYEHVATLAWLTIDPEPHRRMFLRWERNQREKMATDLKRFATLAPSNVDVRRALIDAGDQSAPETADRALAADAYWSRLGLAWEFAFRRTYANLFRPYSAFVHPTVMGLDLFISQSEPSSVGASPAARVCDKAVLHAVSSFADALVVTSHTFGWPPSRDVVAAFAHGVHRE